nr:DUF6607 family protein [uncultured Flavobacterium sp.]
MITQKNYLSVIIAITSLTGFSQDAKKEDINAIKSMCGCYEVKFNFTETFKYPKDSATYKPSATKHETGLEWVELVEDKPNKIVLQHLLIVGTGENDIVKHWRQDWLYENTDLFSFFKDNSWKFNKLLIKNVKGQWTQKVFQVDDSPRYEGSSSWAHIDGKTYWLNTADAPLPRREHTKRNDYNVLKRRNIHEITATGWNHEQDNQKLVRDKSGKDTLLAEEKGLDIYTKVDDSKCLLAQNWWKNNQELWLKVRSKWEKVYGSNKNLSLQNKVNKKSLFSVLFDLKPTATQAEVDAIIDSFVIKQ